VLGLVSKKKGLVNFFRAVRISAVLANLFPVAVGRGLAPK
jgi:hypothetical protein